MRLVVRGEVKHALTESGHAVSVFFFMYHTQTSGTSGPRLSMQRWAPLGGP